jgi:hypothetical protein
MLSMATLRVLHQWLGLKHAHTASAGEKPE